MANPSRREPEPHRYEIDVEHTRLGFVARYMGISPVHGEFRSFDGYVDVVPRHPSTTTAELKVDVISLNTGSVDRDNQLLSPDFLDAERHRHILFRSTRIKPLGRRRYRVFGKVAIRGRTRPLELLAQVGSRSLDRDANEHVAVSVAGELNRRDFGLAWNEALPSGPPIVADRIGLEIDLALLRRPRLPQARNSPADPTSELAMAPPGKN